MNLRCIARQLPARDVLDMLSAIDRTHARYRNFGFGGGLLLAESLGRVEYDPPGRGAFPEERG